MKVTCPYCQKPAKLIDSNIIYGKSYGKVWHCKPCQAWVGCHQNSKKHAPLGRLANAELRRWKQATHAAFDPLWRGKVRRDSCSKNQARNAAYKWLADELGIEEKACHIGKFNVETCKMAIDVCWGAGK